MSTPLSCPHYMHDTSGPCLCSTCADAVHRLRQTDVKSGHYERKVQALEASRDQWETKYEEMSKKYEDTKKELDDFVKEIGNI